MAQSLFSSHPAGLRVVQGVSERQPLWQDKLGVMAGFLAGLPLALAVVNDLLADSPEWVAVSAAVLTVAVTTSLGLRVSVALSRARSQH
jgi:hypothetical protein